MAKKQQMNQKQANQTASGTNVDHVKQQNQQSSQGQGQYGAEFAQGQQPQKTDVQHVKQQNQQSAQKKNQQ
ncbi:gamma-type small acid-soluble spore protein [Pontibacillus salicampi]|uniref:Small, acid-soluble spore protein gamma-type n=1 Tax=Pontibacillus salicampi TaxID=1449801 RepID=A0ABV6LHW1_9BACI